VVRLKASDLLGLVHSATEVLGNTAIDATVRSSVIGYDDGANTIRFFRDGAADGTPAMVTNPANATGNFAIGGSDAASSGSPVKLGHVMVWSGVALQSDDATLYHGGVIPQRTSLSFWHKGTATPGVDEIGGTTPTLNGTVTLFSNPVDEYYDTAGGFAVFASSWGPLLLAAGHLFGSSLRSVLGASALPTLWREMQRIVRCRIVGATEAEVASVFDMLKRRSYVFLGMR
jgi:hypothetical protein